MERSKQQMPWLSRAVRPLLIGVAAGVAAGSLLLAAAAAVMASVQVPMAAVTPIALAITVLASLIGGFTAARLLREQGLLIGAASGLLIFLVIAIAGFGFSVPISGVQVFLKLALTVGGGALGGIAGVNLLRK